MRWLRKFGRWSLLEIFLAAIFSMLLLVVVFANFLASDLPIVVKTEDQVHWPLIKKWISGHSQWTQILSEEATWAIYPPIPYSTNPDPGLSGRYLPPLSRDPRGNKIHWLGTDRLGRDVMACMIHGCRKSMLVALVSMLLAAIIGVSLGIFTGYWKNRYLLKHPLVLLTTVFILVYLLFLLIYEVLAPSSLLISAVILTIASSFLVKRLPVKFTVRIPADHLLMRTIEVFQSVPALLIILALTSIVIQPGMPGLAVIIGLLRWPVFARYARGEVFKIREKNYVVGAKISGLSHWHVMRKHILPEAAGTLMVVFAFGVASVILLESTLSFLGLGVPPEEITWGALLGQAKTNTSAWWLAIFPGLAIFMIVSCLNLTGDRLRQELDPKD